MNSRGSLSPSDDDAFTRAAEALRPGGNLRHPRLRAAAALLEQGQLANASTVLMDLMTRHPHDVDALRLAAEACTRQGRNEEAEKLLEKAVALAPDSAPVRFAHANALLAINRPELALAQGEALAADESGNPMFRALKAIALEAVGEYAASAELFRGLIEEYPTRTDCWLYYADVLRALGRAREGIAAYRKVLALDPGSSRAWWSLANLKTFRFSESDISAMEALLTRADFAPQQRTQLHFVLGKAYGDQAQYSKAFSHYATGNALQRAGIHYEPDVITRQVTRFRSLFTREFFRARQGSGCDSSAPIFLVGMGRSGSTLVEQVLASHSQIEGTRELFDLNAIARELETEFAPRYGTDYPGVVAELDFDGLQRLGERYLQTTKAQRKLGRPFFTDKMGANFLHIGLIHLILPHAKIVDVRRHPLACCFSNFTHLFVKPVKYAYRLNELGQFYRDYVAIMAHFDTVLPGRVHRVVYEQLVMDSETEVRRLLDYLGLPFEEACLQFHKSERAVSTASSEQVRRPLYRDALESWRPYEPWLGPLKAALGPVLDAYPEVPAFA